MIEDSGYVTALRDSLPDGGLHGAWLVLEGQAEKRAGGTVSGMAYFKDDGK